VTMRIACIAQLLCDGDKIEYTVCISNYGIAVT
jgi:hypothetical protein